MSGHAYGLLIVEVLGKHYADISTQDGWAIAKAKIEDARRLAASWNAFEGHSTEIIERCRVTEITSQSWSSVGSAKAVEVHTISEVSELTAVRALLREAFPDVENDYLSDRIKSYLDACDTLEGK